jgi:uridine kinase
VPERKILSIPNFGLDDGVKELNRRIRKLSDSKKIVVIGVSGPTGAGKTFVAQKLHGATLSMDRYYKRIKRLDKGNWDKSRALYLSLLRKNLIRLKQGLPAKVPVWDNVTHSRKGFETLFPPKVLIVEGLHALHPKIIDLLDLKVFVEAPKDIRLQRRLERDEKDRGGWTRESDIEYFHKISEPMYRKHIVPRRAHADLIITT